jgi:plasmid stability protein
MPVINIRNLPQEIHAKMRIRAARANRSMEAEARAILTAVCQADDPVRPASNLQKLVDKLYGRKKPRGVVDALIRQRRKEAERE